jgi:hypothetical protein
VALRLQLREQETNMAHLIARALPLITVILAAPALADDNPAHRGEAEGVDEGDSRPHPGHIGSEPIGVADTIEEEPGRYDAVELILHGGYAMGVGRIHSVGPDALNATGPGVGAGLFVGWRATPAVAVGGSGAFESYAPLGDWYPGFDDGRFARAMSLGLDVHLYPSPEGLTSPWFRLGAGYRVMWLPAPERDYVTEHGPQFLRLGGGVDVMANGTFSAGPFAAADLGLLTWRDGQQIEDGVTFFFNAGVRAVFDVGGDREPSRKETAAR